ncbi:MAG: hypothetical protein ACRD5H_03165 [Nitrososphaerales archaeon]
MEQNTTSSQIFIFETLHEFSRFVDNAVHLHKSELTKYEEELGLMLRQDGKDGAESQWMKDMQDKLSASKKVEQHDEAKKDGDKSDDTKEDKGKEKDKKEEKHMKEKEEKKKKEDKKTSANWRNYNELHIFSGNSVHGKTEIYFMAVNELKAQIDKLKRVQESLAHLMNTGISDAFYLVYTRNGLPEKLVLLPRSKKDQGKFEFKADFVTENVDMPIESSA